MPLSALWRRTGIPFYIYYTLIKVGEDTGEGILKNPVPNAPSRWMPYVPMDDVAASTEKAKSP
jgi:hypothetical protein